jgi:hypothetical protein
MNTTSMPYNFRKIPIVCGGRAYKKVAVDFRAIACNFLCIIWI